MKKQVKWILMKLVISEKYAVIKADEMTNQEAVNFLTENYENTDELNVIENKDHLLIY